MHTPQVVYTSAPGHQHITCGCTPSKTWQTYRLVAFDLLIKKSFPCCVVQVADFTQVLQQLPNNSLLAAAFVTYLGREAEDGRQAAVAQWCDLLGRPPSWSLTGFLSSETELLTWKTEGLSDCFDCCLAKCTRVCPAETSMTAMHSWVSCHIAGASHAHVVLLWSFCSSVG